MGSGLAGGSDGALGTFSTAALEAGLGQASKHCFEPLAARRLKLISCEQQSCTLQGMIGFMDVQVTILS